MSVEGAKPVGKTIKRRRRGRGMTQEDLGTATGLHAGTISRIERGVNKPDLRTLEVIAQALETTVVSLLAEVEPAPAGQGAAS